MTAKANTVGRGLFALLTAGVLVVTFYFPLIGFGYAMDASADLQSRGEGLLLFLPGVALLVLLAGMLPTIRGRLLCGLGIGGSLLLLPSLVACAWFHLPGILGGLIGLLYLWLWWFLVRSKLSPRSAPAAG